MSWHAAAIVALSAIGNFAAATILFTVWPMADRIWAALRREPQPFHPSARHPDARDARLRAAGHVTPRSHAPRDGHTLTPASSRPMPGQGGAR